MANPTSVFATGDGSTTDRNFPFPYISRSHVKVTVDGVAVSFSFIAQNTVRISPAPATGKSIRIYRETPKTPIINWEDGVVILGRDMNASNIQNIYIAEEAFNEATSLAEQAKQFAINSISGAVETALMQSEARLAAILDPIQDAAEAAAALATTKAADAATSLTEVETEAAAVDAAKTATQGFKDASEAALIAFRKIYYGPLASEPTVDPFGAAPIKGAMYYDNGTQKLRMFDGSNWVLAYNELSGIPTLNDSQIINTTAISGASIKDVLEALKAVLVTLQADLDTLEGTTATALASKADAVTTTAALATKADAAATASALAGKQPVLGFAPANAAGQVFSGKIYSSDNQSGTSGMATSTTGLGEIGVRGKPNPGGGAAMMSFDRQNAYAAYFGIDTDNQWKVGGWSMGAVAYPLIHTGNGQGWLAGLGTGAVGSYALLLTSGTNPGDVISGASVRWTNGSGGGSGPVVGYGTWRCMSWSSSTQGNLFQRIS